MAGLAAASLTCVRSSNVLVNGQLGHVVIIGPQFGPAHHIRNALKLSCGILLAAANFVEDIKAT